MVGVATDDGQRMHLVARQGQQLPGVLQQDDPFAGDLSRLLPVLLNGQRSHRVIVDAAFGGDQGVC